MDYQRACSGRSASRSLPRCAWRGPMMGDEMKSARSREEWEEGAESALCDEPLAIVTSPVQCWQDLYTPAEALSVGTLFRQLDLPLVGCPMPLCGTPRCGMPQYETAKSRMPQCSPSRCIGGGL